MCIYAYVCVYLCMLIYVYVCQCLCVCIYIYIHKGFVYVCGFLQQFFFEAYFIEITDKLYRISAVPMLG